MPKITIDVPEYCDDCMFKVSLWNWTTYGEIACSLFNNRIDWNSDCGQYMPCEECLKRRKEHEAQSRKRLDDERRKTDKEN